MQLGTPYMMRLGEARMTKFVAWGTKYMKRLVKVQHVSKPGEPPGKDAGRLYESVRGKVTKTKRGRVTGYVRAHALKRGKPYPLFLEVGTDPKTQGTKGIAPRPFIAPTMAAMEKKAQTMLFGRITSAEFSYLEPTSTMIKKLGGPNKIVQAPRTLIRI